MGAIIPQVITEDRASGAQIIDGSVRFNGVDSYLKRTNPSSGGITDQYTWTASLWIKQSDSYSTATTPQPLFQGGQASGTNYTYFGFGYIDPGRLWIGNYSTSPINDYYPSANNVNKFWRDPNAWYHLVVVYNTSESTGSDRLKLYTNGVRNEWSSFSSAPEATRPLYCLNNATYPTYFGHDHIYNSFFDGYISQFHFVDGQALDPSYFGFEDGLSGVWKPKKYEGTYGLNGCYLPLDGSAPIGQDQSGNNNDWTLYGLTNTISVERATGGKPILNSSGNGSSFGVFGSKVSKTLTTTSGSNSGSGYIFENEGTKPTLSFIRGATYTFDYSESTAHPLRFATAADAAGSTEYTDGTNVSGNVIRITVPHNAPDTLYYYCTNHGGMGNSISVTTDESKADPYAWKNVLALPLNGSANDESNKLNVGSTTKTVTLNGNAAATSLQSNFYGRSFIFDGTGDYLSLSSTSDFGFGTGDFTIECFVYYKGSFPTYEYIFDMRVDSSTGAELRPALYPSSDGGPVEYYINSTTAISGGKFYKDRWNHIAVVRNSSTTTLYLNGISVGSFSDSNNYADAPLVIGQRQGQSAQSWDGYIQDFRVYKGVAKYTSEFIPAASDPYIVPQTPSGVSGGSKLLAPTSGSVHFDGAGDHLTIADHSDWNMGTGDFTMEAYVYLNSFSSSGYDAILTKYAGGAQQFWWVINGSGQQVFYYYYNGGASSVSATAGSMGLKRWYHVAVVRNGNTLHVYQDGVEVTTADLSSAGAMNDSSAPAHIGASGGAGYWFNGYISNVRVVKGTALYKTNFAPPTTALTNVTNTILLCCQSSTSATEAAVTPATITEPTNYIHEGSGGDQISELLKVFDGDTSAGSFAGCRIAGENTFTFGTGIPFTKLEVAASNYNGHYQKFNGVTFTNFGTTYNPAPWSNITSSVTSPLTSFTLSGNGGQTATLHGIRINDEIIYNGNQYPTRFNPFDTDINYSRGQETGYATLDPFADTEGQPTFSQGNTKASNASGRGHFMPATLYVNSGKWYAEFTLDAGSGGFIIGAMPSNAITRNGYIGSAANKGLGVLPSSTTTFNYDNAGSYRVVQQRDKPSNIAREVNSSYWDINDTWGVGLDMDDPSGKVYLWRNNVPYDMPGNFTRLPDGATAINTFSLKSVDEYWTIAVGNDATYTIDANFGQKPFKYLPPEGFQPLCTSNLPPVTSPAASRPDKYFKAATYTGGNGSPVTANTGFQPDLVFAKCRTQSAAPSWYDSVRGTQQRLLSDRDTLASQDRTSVGDGITSFNTDGFTTGIGGNENTGTQSYVAWCWKAGGGSGAGGEFWKDGVQYASAAAANLNGGSIVPTGASINTESGFSILKWTGNGVNSTVNHGLNDAPKFMIHRKISEAGTWFVYHPTYSPTQNLRLNTTGSLITTSNLYNDTAPTSTSFSLGDGGGNADTVEYISYCWAEIPGFSKFGSFEGNNKFKAPMIYTGFTPALVMIKNADDGTTHWAVFDNGRFPDNGDIPETSGTLAWNLASEESAVTGYNMDILSNGFIMRTGGATPNGDNNTMIYAAWAANPMFDVYGAQANAR